MSCDACLFVSDICLALSVSVSGLFFDCFQALGKLTIGDRSPVLLRQVVDGLFELANLKHEEIHFSVGEALAWVGSGKRPSKGAAAAAGASASAASSGAVALPAASSAASSDDSSMLSQILKKIMLDFLPKGSVVTRSAACTWLLCIVKFAGDAAVVQKSLTSIQSAFTHCLTESNQFIQEVAAKGNT